MHAFVTFLMQNDSYLPGALLQAYGLRQQKVRADLLCMVTDEITPSARKALELLFDRVMEVEKIYVPHKRVGKRPYIPYVFTKLHALRLGKEGDLGGAYDKVAILDADLLPIKRYNTLFRLPVPAGTINERKTHVMEWGADGNFIIPASVARDGTWNWHHIYADCPHGRPIPQEITDRVANDPTNMGVIGSLLLVEPSLAEYEAIRKDLLRPSVQQLVGDAFDWPEMQYLTLRWSGQWTNIDLRYHSLNGYPDLAVLYGIHYTGFKPWQFRKAGSMQRYGRRADFQYWFNTYRRMTYAIPDLLAFKKLRRLRQQIDTFQTISPAKKKEKTKNSHKRRQR
ncbi:MAG TPA: hypothetical protein ENJ93_08825 [Chloroflexi bacterium]|nr:hypothetical protein [Chloroflexota bacterium]